VKLNAKKITIDTDELSEENLPKTSPKHEKNLVDRSWQTMQDQYEKINSVFTN
jgi:hypothetical protein